jgi:hypothetical protein
LTAKQKKIFSYVLKIAIVTFTFWFIYRKVVGNQNLKAFVNLIQQIPRATVLAMLLLMLLLMLLNWGLEALKWQRIIRSVEQISLWKAIESVFCGLTLAVFTPNRIGEYGGRVFFLSPKKRIVGVVAMAVGGIGLLVLTNVFGAIAACVFVFRFIPINYPFFLAFCVFATVFCAFFIVFYFNIKWLNGILLSMRFTRKYKKFYYILARYKKLELLKILGFNFARYAVYSSQYLILFKWLIPGIYTLDVLMLISILFFIQSALPSLALFDIGVRSITALFLFKYVSTEHTAVVACIASVWLINIIIPAILGTYFVFKLNFFGNYKRI